MAGKTEIANRVLIKLGQPRVSNVETDPTPAALTINGIWDTVRDSLLQSYPWNFAIKRVGLASDAATPAYGWAVQFSPPVDFLQLLDVKDDIEYVFENGKILVDDSSELFIRYVAKIEATTSWPPLFIEMFVATLALEACDRVTQDKTLKSLLAAEHRLQERVIPPQEPM